MADKSTGRKPALMLCIAVMGVSLASIIIRLSEAPSTVTAAYRLLWTVILLTPATFLKKDTRKELLSVKPRTLWLSVLSGVFLALHFFTWFVSLYNTSIASATIICCTEVIWVAIGYRIFLKGEIGRKAVLSIVIALIGSIMIALTDLSAGSNNLYGDILSLAAAIAVGAYTLLGRVVRKDTSATVYTYIVYVTCAIVLVLLTVIKHEPLFGYGIRSLFCGLLLAIVPTLLGHSMFSWCLKYYSPSFISASKLCEPVISSIFAAILFKEIPTVLQIIGSVIVLAGILYYSILEMRKTE